MVEWWNKRLGPTKKSFDNYLNCLLGSPQLLEASSIIKLDWSLNRVSSSPQITTQPASVGFEAKTVPATVAPALPFDLRNLATHEREGVGKGSYEGEATVLEG